MIVCESVKRNCWNFYDSHGEICVHCGCCSGDKKARYTSRLEVLRRRLAEEGSFDGWYEPLRAVQEKNVASSIKYLKKQIELYEQKLKEVEA